MGSALSVSQGRSEQITLNLPELEGITGILAAPETVVASPSAAAARIEGSVSSQIKQNIKNIGIQGGDLAQIVETLLAQTGESMARQLETVESITSAAIEQANQSIKETSESMTQQLETVESISSTAIGQSQQSSEKLGEILEGIKTPLARYMPFAVAAGVAYVILKLGGK